jgi:hypothetical protein
MFRSGSTLLARALNAHKNIIMASDPFFEFFKYSRNLIHKGVKDSQFDMKAPLEDNFMKPAHIKEAIKKRFPEVVFREDDLERMKKNIAAACEPYSPRVIPFLDMLTGGSTPELFGQLMDILQRAYPNENARYVGFKEVWTEEFIEPLLALPGRELYCIHIIRDPRAVIASKKKKTETEGNYPLKFMIRQWRKSIAYSIINSNNARYTMLLYEDLVRHPEEQMRRICDRIGVEFSESLLAAGKFTDGSGEPWTQNSSYGTSETFNAAFLEKWRDVLSEDEIEIIEMLCRPEMRYLRYEPSASQLELQKLAGFTEDPEKLSEWIRKYDFSWTKQAIIEEITRLFIAENKHIQWGDEVLDLFFIDGKVYRRL